VSRWPGKEPCARPRSSSCKPKRHERRRIDCRRRWRRGAAPRSLVQATLSRFDPWRLEKLLRTGQIRVDGKRVKASLRLAPGQVIRVPPLGEPAPPAAEGEAAARPAKPRADDDRLIAELRRRVLYRDPEVLIIDKPAGLAVQGGTATDQHLDRLLDGLSFEAPDRPRLVHRLDRDTSGVLVLGRSAPPPLGSPPPSGIRRRARSTGP
jgi:Pseudouridylate synthases, 23S RNA-specific